MDGQQSEGLECITGVAQGSSLSCFCVHEQIFDGSSQAGLGTELSELVACF